MAGKSLLKRLLNELADEKVKTVKRCKGHYIYMRNIKDNMIEEFGRFTVDHFLCPCMTVSVFITRLRQFVNIESDNPNGFKGKGVESLHQKLNSLEARILVNEKNDRYYSFLKEVLRTSMDLTLWIFLADKSVRRSVIGTFTRIFKTTYTLFSSDIEWFDITGATDWTKVWCIITIAGMKPMNKFNHLNMRNYAKSWDSIMKYTTSSNYVEESDYLRNAMFKYTPDVYTEEMLDLYGDIVSKLWKDYKIFLEKKSILISK